MECLDQFQPLHGQRDGPGRLLRQEQRDIGIYKALGFTDGMLRRSFALRFGVVAGAFLWWLSLSLATCAVKKKAAARRSFPAHRVFGCVLVVFAVVLFLRLLP